MTQTNNSMEQDIFQIQQAEFIDSCLVLAMVALSVYEYLVTLDQEVALVWTQKIKFSVFSLLLASTRVCMVLSATLVAASPPSTCTGFKAFSNLEKVVGAIQSLQVALFPALRVSALYDRNIALFATIFALGLVPIGANIFNDARATYIQEPGVCIQDFNVSDSLARKLILISRIPVIAADVLVLILTWAKTCQQILRSRLLTCLARDGTLYFLVFLTMNVLQIIMFRTHLGTPISIILPAMPPILINRFMLNLGKMGEPSNMDRKGDPNRSLVSTLGFQLSEQTVGSMGEALDYDNSVALCEYEDELFEESLVVDDGV